MSPPTAPHAPSDPGASVDPRRIEAAIGRLLQVGTTVAALLVFAGAFLYLARHGRALPDWSSFRSVPDDLRSPAGIVLLALAGDDRGLVALGMLVLVATPVARVALSVVAFALLRDRKFVVIASIVLAGLLASLAGVLPHGADRHSEAVEPPTRSAPAEPPH
jgi:uncharacterized membrane protein